MCRSSTCVVCRKRTHHLARLRAVPSDLSGGGGGGGGQHVQLFAEYMVPRCDIAKVESADEGEDVPFVELPHAERDGGAPREAEDEAVRLVRAERHPEPVRPPFGHLLAVPGQLHAVAGEAEGGGGGAVE
jgi:hypothetical protein